MKHGFILFTITINSSDLIIDARLHTVIPCTRPLSSCNSMPHCLNNHFFAEHSSVLASSRAKNDPVSQLHSSFIGT
jgi:hypothetical protein